MRFSRKEEFRKHLGRTDLIAENELEQKPVNDEIRIEDVKTDPRASGLSNIGPEVDEACVGHLDDGVIGIASQSSAVPLSPHLAPDLPIYASPYAFQIPWQYSTTDPTSIWQEHVTTDFRCLSDGTDQSRDSPFWQYYDIPFDHAMEGGLTHSNPKGATDSYEALLPKKEAFAENGKDLVEASADPIWPSIRPLRHESLIPQAPEYAPISATENSSFQPNDYVDHHLCELYKAPRLQHGAEEKNRQKNGGLMLEKPLDLNQVDEMLRCQPADMSRDSAEVEGGKTYVALEATKNDFESDVLPRFEQSDTDTILNRIYEEGSAPDEPSNDTTHINQGDHCNAEDQKIATSNSAGYNFDDVAHIDPKVSESLPKPDDIVLVGDAGGGNPGVTGSEFGFDKETKPRVYIPPSTGKYKILPFVYDNFVNEARERLNKTLESKEMTPEKSEEMTQYLRDLLNQLVVEEDMLVQTAVLSALVELMANWDNRRVYEALDGILNDQDDSFSYASPGWSPLLYHSYFLIFPQGTLETLDYWCGDVVRKVNQVLSGFPDETSFPGATASPRRLKSNHKTRPGGDSTVTARLQDLVEKLESRYLYERQDGLLLLRQYKKHLGGECVAIMLLPLLQRSLEKRHSPTVRAVYQSLKVWGDNLTLKVWGDNLTLKVWGDNLTLQVWGYNPTIDVDAPRANKHGEPAETSMTSRDTSLKHDPVLHDLVDTLAARKLNTLSRAPGNLQTPQTSDRGLQDSILTQLDIMARSLTREARSRFSPILSAVIKVLSQCSGDVQFQDQIYRVFSAYNGGRNAVLGLRMSTSSNSDCKVFEIPSILGDGHSVSALGDYCAKRNFMKEECAKQMGLHIDRQATSSVIIGSGKKIVTAGIARTSFRFKDEKKEYSLLFHILPSCVHDVILGKGFLKITKTFSNLANKARRVQERVLKGISQHHLFYLGEYAPRFQGLINGVPQEALADSGAKVLIMDEDYAQSMGLPVASGKDHQTRLKFADGSTASTCGMTFGVEWEFGHGAGGERFVLDFHILRNAPANVILSDQFLFGTEAFSQYECFLVDDDDEDDEAFFFAIDIDETYPGQVRLDMSSLSNKKHAETVLRGEREDEIASLPREQQAEAWRREYERRAQWEQDFAALKLCLPALAPTASTSISSSSRTSGGSTHLLINGSTPTAQTVSAVTKRSRWLLKFKRRVST